MRVCFVVLAAVFALLAGCDTVLATVSPKDSKNLSSGRVANVDGVTKRSLRSYGTRDLGTKVNAVEEERGGAVDSASAIKKLMDQVDTIKKLMDPDDIKAALTKFDDRMTLFSKWFPHEKDIVAKLSDKTKILENMPILTKFNDFRTSMHYNQVLTKWLDTKTLDEIGAALQTYKTKATRDQFTTWYRSGITPKEFSEAIAKVENPIKRKGYRGLDSHYKMFAQGEANKAKRTAQAAAKKAEEFAAKKATVMKLAEAAAKRANEIKDKKAMTKKVADAAAKRGAELEAKKAAAAAVAV